jgi:uncharacterized protein (DUF1778 family)
MAGLPRQTTLDLRVTAEQKEVIRRAADLRGQTMIQFVIEVVEPAARELVERAEVIELSHAAWQELLRMVETEEQAPALARREAAEFLAEMGLAPTGATGR